MKQQVAGAQQNYSKNQRSIPLNQVSIPQHMETGEPTLSPRITNPAEMISTSILKQSSPFPQGKNKQGVNQFQHKAKRRQSPRATAVPTSAHLFQLMQKVNELQTALSEVPQQQAKHFIAPYTRIGQDTKLDFGSTKRKKVNLTPFEQQYARQIQQQAQQYLQDYEKQMSNAGDNESPTAQLQRLKGLGEQLIEASETNDPQLVSMASENNLREQINNIVINLGSMSPRPIEKPETSGTDPTQNVQQELGIYSSSSMYPQKVSSQDFMSKDAKQITPGRSDDQMLSTDNLDSDQKRRNRDQKGYQSHADVHMDQKLSYQQPPNTIKRIGPKQCPVHGVYVRNDKKVVKVKKRKPRPASGETERRCSPGKIGEVWDNSEGQITEQHDISAQIDTRSYSSKTDAADIPDHIQQLSTVEKERMSDCLMTELSAIAEGKFQLGQKPKLVQSTAYVRPYSIKTQGPATLQAREQEKIEVSAGEQSMAKLRPIDEFVSEDSAGHWKNPTIALSNVPTHDRHSKAQKSVDLYSVYNGPEYSHSDATSFEQFYEFEKFKKRQSQTNSQNEQESGEDQGEEFYDSEEPSLSNIHVDTQYDDVTSECRFVRNRKGSKRSKLSVNRSRKPQVLSTNEEELTQDQHFEINKNLLSEVSPKMSNQNDPSLLVSEKEQVTEMPLEEKKEKKVWRKTAQTSSILEHDLKGESHHLTTITDGQINYRNLYEECTCKHGIPTDSQDSQTLHPLEENYQETLSFKFQTEKNNVRFVSQITDNEKERKKTVAFSHQNDEEVPFIEAPAIIHEVQKDQKPYQNIESANYKDQKDIGEKAIIASDGSMFEHSKKSRVQSANRSYNSRDLNKAPPKGILITSKNRSAKPQHGKASRTYSKASGVSYAVAVKEINSQVHEKNDQLGSLNLQTDHQIEVNQRYRGAETTTNLKLTNKDSMGTSSVVRPSTAVAAVKKMQDAYMSSPGSSDKKDEKVRFERSSSPKLDQQGVKARSTDGLHISGANRQQVNADQSKEVTLKQCTSEARNIKDQIEFQENNEQSRNMMLSHDDAAKKLSSQEITGIDFQNCKQFQSPTSEFQKIQSHVSHKDIKGNTQRTQIQIEEEDQLNNSYVFVDVIGHESHADQKSRIKSAERNVKFLDSKTSGELVEGPQELEIDSNIKVQDGGLINLNSPICSSQPQTESKNQNYDNKTPLKKLDPQQEEIQVTPDIQLTNTQEKELYEYSKEEKSREENCDNQHVLSGKQILAVEEQNSQCDSQGAPKQHVDSKTDLGLAQPGPYENSYSKEKENNDLTVELTDNQEVMDKLRMASMSGAGLGSVQLAQEEIQELSTKIQKYWQLFEKKSAELISIQNDQKNKVDRQYISRTNQVSANGVYYTPVHDASPYKKQEQVNDSHRINSTNDLHTNAKNLAFIHTKQSQNNGPGRRSENENSHGNLKRRIRSTHTTRAESVKNIQEMRRQSGYDSQTTGGIYTRMKRSANLSQGQPISALTAIKRRNLVSGKDLLANALTPDTQMIATTKADQAEHLEESQDQHFSSQQQRFIHTAMNNEIPSLAEIRAENMRKEKRCSTATNYKNFHRSSGKNIPSRTKTPDLVGQRKNLRQNNSNTQKIPSRLQQFEENTSLGSDHKKMLKIHQKGRNRQHVHYDSIRAAGQTMQQPISHENKTGELLGSSFQKQYQKFKQKNCATPINEETSYILPPTNYGLSRDLQNFNSTNTSNKHTRREPLAPNSLLNMAAELSQTVSQFGAYSQLPQSLLTKGRSQKPRVDQIPVKMPIGNSKFR